MLGESLALGSALAWATAVVLYRRAGDVGAPALNLFKSVLSASLLAVTLVAMGDGVRLDRSAEPWARLVASGLLGIAVADTIFLGALRRIGPALLSIVECVYSPIVVLLSVLVLGEQVGGVFAVGAGLVAVGVATASWPQRDLSPAEETPGREQRKGVAMGLFAVAIMAVGVIVAKPALSGGGVVEIALVRVVVGLAGQLVFLGARRELGRALRIFRPQAAWRWLLPGSVLGAYLSGMLWIGGIKFADASVASVLSQMAMVFTLVLARLFLGEPLSPRRLVAGGAALAGALVVALAP